MNIFFQKNNRGFTLLEALVSIAILVTAVTGPLFYASRTISSGESARNDAIASYLAQEGVEILRKQRDDDSLSSPIKWIGSDDTDIPPACIFTEGSLGATCSEDPIGPTPATPKPFFVQCVGGSTCGTLKIPQGNFYRQSGGGITLVGTITDTIYKRTFQLIRPAGAAGVRELNSIVTVSWQEHGKPRSYILQDTFFRN